MTAQLPSKVRLAQIASFSKSMALPPSHDEIEAMDRALLAAHEQEPVPNYIGSKNALEAIVAFIKSSSNPTLSDYNIVSERLFADNCQSLSSHVIEYITHIGEALEDLRQAASHPALVPAVPESPPFAVMQRALDAFYAEDDEVPENQMLAAYRVFLAAMLNGGKS